LMLDVGKPLIPVQVTDFDPGSAPWTFRQLHWLDLRGWEGSATDARFVSLIRHLHMIRSWKPLTGP
jgi:hypothetical protein